MEKQLQNIFEFLVANRIYNHLLQERYYKSVLSPYVSPKDNVVSLLYHIANTQSQPRIDKLADFYKSVINDIACFESFTSFIYKINSGREVKICFDSLFNGMQSQNGWGKKTAALFTKSIYHIHIGQYSEQVKIWNDVPETITDQDNFYLPVDSVIVSIFRKLDNSKNWNFDNINQILKVNYSMKQMEIWDDLWFWGFITQNGSGDQREFVWNENKYWVIKESDKSLEMVMEIKRKATEFLDIIL
jgi:hypothetical protein